MSDNITVVKEFYAALGRGELPAAIDLVAEEVDWQSPVTRTHPPEIPWSSIRRTKQEVAVFFKQLGQTDVFCEKTNVSQFFLQEGVNVQFVFFDQGP